MGWADVPAHSHFMNLSANTRSGICVFTNGFIVRNFLPKGIIIMSANKPLLTISLLSSGRSATIERCLSSLAPFKEQLDTEIIVVDTDSKHSEEVHSILAQYTDRIIPFDWIDDFSAARNVAVDAASGEWFLFLDDDEWFIDPAPMIAFLKSDENRKYHWATYLIRNFFDDELQTYRDAWASRMFRLDC